MLAALAQMLGLTGDSAAPSLLVGGAASLARLAAGFVVCVVAGAMLGGLMWRVRALDDLLRPPLLGLASLPSVCWAPLVAICFGGGEGAILFVLVLGSVFTVAASMRDGLGGISPLYLRAGAMLGASGWRLYRHVLLPASLPAIAGSLRLGFAFAWRSLLGGELLLQAQRKGLGQLLHAGRENRDAAAIVAVMLVMILIGACADRFAFARLESAVQRRFGLAA